MGVAEIILTAAILCLAGLAQSVVGFGYALFATPLLLLVGLPLPSVITLVATCSMCQAALGARQLRNDVPWKLAAYGSGGRMIGMIGGIFALKQLASLDRSTIQMFVGAMLCLTVIVQALWRPKPQDHIVVSWAVIAFLVSGFVSGLCGMGGPAVVIWTMTQNWSALKTRGFLFAVLAALIPFQLVLLSLTFGGYIFQYAGIGLLMFPLVYLETNIGMRIGNRIERNQLQRIAYAVLLVMGVTALAPAIKLL